MRAKTINVYQFSELSDRAKERAKEHYAANNGYTWADEAIESIKALAAHFGGKMSHWTIDFFECSHSDATFEMPDMTAAEIKKRLGQLGTYNKRTGKGHGDCKLTGVCHDEDAIDGFRLAWRGGERDLEKLMDDAFYHWLKAAQSDCRSQYEDEQFAENCEANNYEFYEDGSWA